MDMAISNSKVYIESQLSKGAKVLIAGFAAPSRNLSGYISDELSARLVNGKLLAVVERSREVMQVLTAETNYQLSGEVSDDSIQSIGYKTGAEVVITGSISGMGDQYRLILKLTGVKSGELRGQWSGAMQIDTVLNALLVSARPPQEKPRWTFEPLQVRAKYESASTGISQWYYDVGLSQKAASEQLARTRARQNIQQVIAENIASEMKGRIDITALSLFSSSGIEEAEFRIEAALTNSIKTKVPRYETLEWHIENGKLDGKDWYIAYVLVRFPRQDIISMVGNIAPANIADMIIRQEKATPLASARDELIWELEHARDYALEGIREGLTDR
ncbi:hypothetical protein FACS1894200_10040 [Spirochaetia bacterium]|nr:hypothetical protein FACS1894200_10040 [Spirochaetia bacterium]